MALHQRTMAKPTRHRAWLASWIALAACWIGVAAVEANTEPPRTYLHLPAPPGMTLPAVPVVHHVAYPSMSAHGSERAAAPDMDTGEPESHTTPFDRGRRRRLPRLRAPQERPTTNEQLMPPHHGPRDWPRPRQQGWAGSLRAIMMSGVSL